MKERKRGNREQGQTERLRDRETKTKIDKQGQTKKGRQIAIHRDRQRDKVTQRKREIKREESCQRVHQTIGSDCDLKIIILNQ